jgi:pimeloyl-ACP methyl ester carboxylesterase
MGRWLILMALVLLNGAFYSSAHAARQSLEGDWVGAVKLRGKLERVDMHFTVERGEMKGTIDFPLQKNLKIPFSRISLKASRVHLEWLEKSETLVVVDGRLMNGRISGVVQQGQARDDLQLMRVARVDPSLYTQFEGIYELGPNRLINIHRSEAGLRYLDFTSGRTGILFPVSETAYFSGPAFLLPTPMVAQIRFARNPQGEVTGLVWQEGSAPEKRARRLKFRREDVRFRQGEVTLSGTLVLPNTRGPHPAIVRIHGAGPADRRNGADEFYAYHGIAFLSYDKRGVGQSTGDWRKAGVEELAGDALAGVQLLKSRPDIDTKRIGLGGGSEGGWVAPLVASRDPDIAFILLVAGPVLSFAEEVLNEIEDSLRAFGFSGDDLKAALAFRKTINEMIRSGEALTDAGWEKVQTLAQKAQHEKWFPYVRPAAKRDWRQDKYHLMLRFDPQPLWEKTSIPVLALYGGLDRNVPAARNVAALEGFLKKAGNKDYRIIVFPKANHEGIEAERGFLDDEAETARWTRFVPGYFDTSLAWILSRGNRSK